VASQDTRGQGRCGRGHIEGVLLDKDVLIVAVLIFSVVAGIKKVIIVPLEVGQAR